MLKTISPIDNTINVEREYAQNQEIEDALNLSKKAFLNWRNKPLDERKKLLTLQKIQGGGITEQQFNKTYKNSSLDFGCGPLAFKTEDVIASCNTNGQTFEYVNKFFFRN